MPFFCNLDDRCSSESRTTVSTQSIQSWRSYHVPSFPVLCRLLALLLALAAAPSVLLAEDGDHDRGKANDPTGVWVQRSLPVVLITFHSDGTYLADFQGEGAFIPGNESPGFQITSPTHGLWKKTGPKTLVATALSIQYSDDGSFYALHKVRVTGVLSASGDQMDLTVSGGNFDLNGNLIPNPPVLGSTGRFERLRLECP